MTTNILIGRHVSPAAAAAAERDYLLQLADEADAAVRIISHSIVGMTRTRDQRVAEAANYRARAATLEG